MKNFMYALRYLLKVRGNNLTRVVSLILGLGVGILLFSYINYQFTYDRDMPDKDRIYKMYVSYSVEGLSGVSDRVYAPVAAALQADCPQVEAATHIYGMMTYDYSYGDNTYMMDFYAVDSMFFDVLDYGVVSGNPKDIYAGENNIMLSESMARTVFGNDDPMGKVMQDQNGNDMYVVGVFNNPPLNTHLKEFDMLGSFRRIEQTHYVGWNGGDDYQTYVKLYPSAKIEDVEAQLDSIFEKYQSKATNDEYGQRHFFGPLTKARVTLGTRMQYLNLFLFIAVLVIFVASMNYVLVSISGLVNRSKTIAMLRCNGARKWDVFNIFLSETFLILLAAALCTAILFGFLHNSIVNMCSTPLNELFALRNIWVPMLIILAVFLLAGLIPASMFSAIPLTAAFKGVTDNRRRWKQALLCFQIICITFSLFMLQISILQFNRLHTGDQGYEHDRLVIVNLMGNHDMLLHYEDELRALECVENAGTGYFYPIYGYSGQPAYDENTHEFLFSSRIEWITPEYFPTMGMRIVEGENFTEESSIKDVIVNEKYVEMRGWKDSPIGHEITDRSQANATRYRVIGVVNDFRIEADKGEYQAIVFHNIKEEMSDDNQYYGGFRTMVRLCEMSSDNIAAVEAQIKPWLSTDNFHVTVYDQLLEKQIRGERSFRNVLILVSIITFVIALIGLIGYLNDETRRRRKEIAIRKVNGAVMQDIIAMLARNISQIVLPSIGVGLAAGAFVASLWLQQFSNRTPMYWWIYAASAFAVAVIVAVVEVAKTWRVADSNPIDMIKTE